MSVPARLVLPALRWRRRGGYAHERRRIAEALRHGVGGFIVFRAPREALASLIRELHDAAGRPLIIGADLERGPAQQVDGLTELPPPAVLGALDDLAATEHAGAVTAAGARSVGINWAFAPVADLDLEPDNPIVQTRSFGADPARVGAHVAAWVRGCEGGGALASVKHYPGHGRTTTDSHEALPAVEAPLEVLLDSDLVPFAHGIGAGASSVMTAHVAYPGWDPSGTAATFSAAMLGHLRQGLGFEGAIVTDALIMGGALQENPEVVASRTALAAGCDLLLYPRDFAAVIGALDRWSRDATARRHLDRALERQAWLLGRAQRPAAPDSGDAAGAFADGLADRALEMLRGDPPSLRAPLAIEVVDDDVGGPYVIPPRDVFRRTLEAQGVPLRPGGTRVVLVYSEPRSWKGRGSLGPASIEALQRLAPGAHLVALFAHPRWVSQIPGTAPVLGAWHGLALMQRAVARWVVERVV